MLRQRSSVRASLACLLLTGCAEAAAQQAAPGPEVGTTQSFVACPVYRDTDMGRKSGCWLADDAATELRYDVTWAPIKPQTGRPVLIEGVVTADADTCGGVVLKPVRVSVLSGRCPRTIIPAGAYPGRPSPPPVEALKPASEPRTLPPPPYERREFQIYFEFGRDFLIYQHAEVALEKIQLYVQASHAQQVLIQGFAATDPVQRSGRRLAEPLSLAESRAAMVALALQRLGIPGAILRTEAHGSPMPSDLEAGALAESSKRRVTITVTP
ncbi:MAG TPA: OmpA family protein [Polyangiales bacterium]|nr:OmpA family protein [Polyangiales bacterium]